LPLEPFSPPAAAPPLHAPLARKGSSGFAAAKPKRLAAFLSRLSKHAASPDKDKKPFTPWQAGRSRNQRKGTRPLDDVQSIEQQLATIPNARDRDVQGVLRKYGKIESSLQALRESLSDKGASGKSIE